MVVEFSNIYPEALALGTEFAISASGLTPVFRGFRLENIGLPVNFATLNAKFRLTMENNSFTIVVPTYNERQFNVKRSIAYLTQYFNKIIIVDSSKSKYPYNGEDNRVRYIHCPELGYYEKLMLGVESIDTEFVAFCADDDFVMPKGVYNAVRFLKENPGYTIARGRQISFLENSNTSPKYLWRLSEWEGVPIENNTSSQRLVKLLSSFKASTFYAVHRKELMKELLQGALDNSTDYLMGEYIIASMAVIRGKFKITEDLYVARHAHPSNNPHNFYNFIMDGTFDEKYKKFKDLLAAELIRVEKIRKTEAENAIDKSLVSYLENEGMSLDKLQRIAIIKRILRKAGILENIIKIKQNIFGKKDYSFKADNVLAQPPNPFEDPKNKDYGEFCRLRQFIEGNVK